jgi:hypothetical protein
MLANIAAHPVAPAYRRIQIISANGNLLTGCNRLAIRVKSYDHSGLAPTPANCPDFPNIIGKCQ